MQPGWQSQLHITGWHEASDLRLKKKYLKYVSNFSIQHNNFVFLLILLIQLSNEKKRKYRKRRKRGKKRLKRDVCTQASAALIFYLFFFSFSTNVAELSYEKLFFFLRRSKNIFDCGWLGVGLIENA